MQHLLLRQRGRSKERQAGKDVKRCQSLLFRNSTNATHSCFLRTCKVWGSSCSNSFDITRMSLTSSIPWCRFGMAVLCYECSNWSKMGGIWIHDWGTHAKWKSSSCYLIALSILIFIYRRITHSIEDPFETWYDIAHVIKGPQMTYIRKEFLVSAWSAMYRVDAVTSPLYNPNLYCTILFVWKRHTFWLMLLRLWC